jgi:excisionase family DNA binding protein
MSERLLKPSEVAARLAISERAVRRLIETGKLSAINVSENPEGPKPRYRVTREAMEEFITARTTRAPQTPAEVAPFRTGKVIQRY